MPAHRVRRLSALHHHLRCGAAAAAAPAPDTVYNPHGRRSSELPAGAWDGRHEMLTVGLEAHAPIDPAQDIARDGLSQQQLMVSPNAPSDLRPAWLWGLLLWLWGLPGMDQPRPAGADPRANRHPCVAA